ncbi:MAG TPA: saccharopine dehydrogenase C-terminal domain-containing protein [Azospirillaceae bacterium]|nr:saccharopine dehydrogenase C-terminal domain-containing protein [Azospirillaceae bacterium]
MSHSTKYIALPGRLVMVGCGSIGQGVLPLILRHIDITADRITIVTADERGHDVADEYGVRFIKEPLTRDNLERVIKPLLGKGDFLLNLSVDVSSIALIELCQRAGALYLDTCIEPWPGGYTDPNATPSQRSNYGLREQALALRKTHGTDGPTAVLTHGANPGLVSHFMKKALLDIARDVGMAVDTPRTRERWAALAHELDVKTVHIAERDTQVSAVPKKRGEFVNTWSIDGFVSEGCQPAELGWGSHEKHFPKDGSRHEEGCGAAIYLNRPGVTTRVRTWTPQEGPFHGYLITHGEAISISDYYTVRNDFEVVYRPTAHYAYHPCDDAIKSIHEFAGKNFVQQAEQRLMMHEITGGIDELGVLLAGHKKGAYWYGSQLSVEEARRLCPHNNATSLQVCVAVLSGIVWALENPNRGVVEPDEMDFERCLEICMPYLGPVVGEYTDWTPLEGRNKFFPEDIDPGCPWQFKNIRVA